MADQRNRKPVIPRLCSVALVFFTCFAGRCPPPASGPPATPVPPPNTHPHLVRCTVSCSGVFQARVYESGTTTVTTCDRDNIPLLTFNDSPFTRTGCVREGTTREAAVAACESYFTSRIDEFRAYVLGQAAASAGTASNAICSSTWISGPVCRRNSSGATDFMPNGCTAGQGPHLN
jgi:hypothetical protein